jgi:hypothetical protein
MSMSAIAWSGVAGLLLVGCSGDDGPAATCGKVQPCGGDVVGQWMVATECESRDHFDAAVADFATMAAQSWCPGQTLRAFEPRVSGSLSFDAAGTYSVAFLLGANLDVNLPVSCLSGLSCAGATANFQAQIAAGTYANPNVSSVSCVGSSDCVCRSVLSAPQSETGTYSIAGTALTFTDMAGGFTDNSYCVEGNALHLLTTSMASTGQTNIDADLVAVRQ